MSLKVIGAGFGRTGTMSMKAALEQPVPDMDFPFINDSEATRGIINRIIEEGYEAAFSQPPA